MDLKATRNHLCRARSALGPGHALSERIQTLERRLTPGDPLFRDDAVSAERDLLSISAELEQLPKMMPLTGPGSAGVAGHPRAEVPAGLNEAIQQIAEAIALL